MLVAKSKSIITKYRDDDNNNDNGSFNLYNNGENVYKHPNLPNYNR